MNVNFQTMDFPNRHAANQFLDNEILDFNIPTKKTKTTDDIQEFEDELVKKWGNVPSLENFVIDEWKMPLLLQKSKTTNNIEDIKDDILFEFNMEYPTIQQLAKKWNIVLKQKSKTMDDIEQKRKELIKKYGYIPKPKHFNYYKECQICFSNPVGNFLNCNCKMFCRECIGKSFESQIDLQGTNSVFKCPNKECDRIVPNNIAFQYTSKEFEEKFQLWRQKQGENIDDEANTITKLWKWWYCKKCPNCDVYTEKVNGCDTMTCYWCNATWCWKCRTKRPAYEIHDCVPARTSNKYLNKGLKIIYKIEKYCLLFSFVLLILNQFKHFYNLEFTYFNIIFELLAILYTYYYLKKSINDPNFRYMRNVLFTNIYITSFFICLMFPIFYTITRGILIGLYILLHPILSFIEPYKNVYGLHTFNDHKQFLSKFFI